MTDLAKLVVKLEAQSAQLTAELQKAKRQVQGFDADVRRIGAQIGTGLAVAGTAAGAGLAVMVKQAVDAADELALLSQRTGISTEALSQLQYAAQMSGLEGLNGELTKLSRSIVEAAGGTGDQAAAFRALGVEVVDAAGQLRAADAVLLDVAEAFSQFEDGAAKSAAAQALFGKSGAELIPFLNEGRAGLQALREEADRYGLTISQDVAQAADAFNDNLDRLQAMGRGVATQLAASLLPTLESLSNRLVEVTSDSEATRRGAESLGLALRSLYGVAATVGNTFQIVGKSIAGTVGAIVAAARGEFGEMRDILRQVREDVDGDFRDIFESFGSTAVDISTPITSAGNAAAAARGKILSYRGAVSDTAASTRSAKQATDEWAISLDAAASIAAEVERLESERNAVIEEGRRVFEATRTPLERYRAEVARLNDLLARGAVDQDTYSRAIQGAQDDFDRLSTKVEDTTDRMSVYAEQAARNMQDAFADFLFDPFESGLRGMLDSFEQTLRRMAAEAAAAQIFEGLGFGTGGGGGGSGGILGQLVGLGVSAFGALTTGSAGNEATALALADIAGASPRAGGGPVSAGQPYVVGEVGPELFVPDVSGSVVSNKDLKQGGMVINQTFVLSAPASRETQAQVAAQAGAGVQRALRRDR